MYCLWFLLCGIIPCNLLFGGRQIAPRKISKEVAEKKDEQLRDYELVLIISPEIAEEGFEAILEKTSQFVTGSGGVVADVERWGKKRLAYPIDHFMEGSYVLTRLKLKTTLSKELKANLQISEDVLRHLLIRVDG